MTAEFGFSKNLCGSELARDSGGSVGADADVPSPSRASSLPQGSVVVSNSSSNPTSVAPDS
ncbi:hypothetical protein FHK92_20885 [Pseudomonas brassicacearum subsp. neoaurantiaca]|uniref:Uncharacterized protein n=1 Tax=Pseudomonas brassicacearum subsp. neoaurantiaca TaxID=494916 RepID=A0A7V8UES4_9PSED|nr:hypothetical protein [Pseudomonas brassicacearum subsp. neoaurantiaca]